MAVTPSVHCAYGEMGSFPTKKDLCGRSTAADSCLPLQANGFVLPKNDVALQIHLHNCKVLRAVLASSGAEVRMNGEVVVVLGKRRVLLVAHPPVGSSLRSADDDKSAPIGWVGGQSPVPSIVQDLQ
jgi:hypothetical protein